VAVERMEQANLQEFAFGVEQAAAGAIEAHGF
jgi:hypothetical protein